MNGKGEIKKYFPLELEVVYQLLRENKAFVTGSERFGCSTEKSDVNIVIKFSDIDELLDPVNRDFVIGDDEQRGDLSISMHKYCVLGMKEVNIIITRNDDVYHELLFATEMIAKLFDFPEIKPEIKNKELRLSTFETLKNLHFALTGRGY